RRRILYQLEIFPNVTTQSLCVVDRRTPGEGMQKLLAWNGANRPGGKGKVTKQVAISRIAREVNLVAAAVDRLGKHAGPGGMRQCDGLRHKQNATWFRDWSGGNSIHSGFSPAQIGPNWRASWGVAVPFSLEVEFAPSKWAAIS